MMEPMQHKYNAAPAEDHEDTRSSTEVEESLMGDEKQWRQGYQRPARKQRTCLSVLASFRWVIDTTLLLIILGFVVRDQVSKPAERPWQMLGDLTGVGPKFSEKITTFKIDQSFAPNNTADFFKNETLDRWNSLMPIGMGFQWVKDPSKYHDLPTPIDWPEKTVFTTSVTHQIHCLYAIVQTYSGLTSNHTLPDDHHWHMIHCFDYLRQTILCCGDTAIEGHETTFPDHNGGSDGWDSKHVCKDYGQIKSYLEGVRAYDDQLIY